MAGSPVRTGIDPSPSSSCHKSIWFPRTHGDRPLLLRVTSDTGMGSPVRTGIDRTFNPFTCCVLRFPRTHGDRPESGETAFARNVVPPYARG